MHFFPTVFAMVPEWVYTVLWREWKICLRGCPTNEAWEFEIASFEELLQPVDEEKLKTSTILADMEEFRDILISAYNEIPSNAVKKYAPNNMCLASIILKSPSPIHS